MDSLVFTPPSNSRTSSPGPAASGTLRLRVGTERAAVYRMLVIGRDSQLGLPTSFPITGFDLGSLSMRAVLLG
jgi:hypothetical protein